MTNRSPLFQLRHALTEADIRTYQPELENLQGNILKSHGRGAAVHIFLRFKNDKRLEARRFLRRFAGEITSAAEQIRQAQRFRKTGTSGEWFASLCLSAKGYRYLKLSLEGFSAQFQHGMAAARLHDPPAGEWEPKFREVHAMIILADDRAEVLTEQISVRREELEDLAEVGIEFGLTMRNEAENPIEHFGYADGVSQPLFFERDLQTPPLCWNPYAGPSLVLVQDPHGGSRTASGTYFVFRKLEQNVREFKVAEKAMARKLHLRHEEQEQAGAMMVGRFEDGTPLALHRTAGRRPGKRPQNDFTYDDDPQGNRCPLAAHIRIMNPRTEEEKLHRIARRGITYGDPTPPGEDDDTLPSTGVGLLFQCCQADLANQFEYLQHLANRHSSRHGGPDPLIGQAMVERTDLEFPAGWDKPGRTQFTFHRFVKMKGGEYFFVPSISFFERL
jgi:Dyp-type peroxidase family